MHSLNIRFLVLVLVLTSASAVFASDPPPPTEQAKRVYLQYLDARNVVTKFVIAINEGLNNDPKYWRWNTLDSKMQWTLGDLDARIKRGEKTVTFNSKTFMLIEIRKDMATSYDAYKKAEHDMLDASKKSKPVRRGERGA